jgi:hypothetical protein
MDRNEGVVVSGGSFQADTMAVGRKASVTVGVPAAGVDPELFRRLEEFLELMDRYAAALPDAPSVRSTTEVLQQEIAKAKPNRITIRGLLAGLTDAVSSVAPLLTAVEAIKTTLATLL